MDSKRRRNDEERRQWVSSDEGLYDWMRSTHKGMPAFIRANRAEIDEAIDAVLDQEPAS